MRRNKQIPDADNKAMAKFSVNRKWAAWNLMFRISSVRHVLFQSQTALDLWFRIGFA
jgi:hypothetical protein